MQEKLLRVIEYGEFERASADNSPCSGCAVGLRHRHANLPALSRSGQFRADLLDRLPDVITLPPLRARREDILLLGRHFAERLSQELWATPFLPDLASRFHNNPLGYSWPGNVRELRNVIERSLYRQAEPELPLASLVLDPFVRHGVMNRRSCRRWSYRQPH